MSKAPVNKLIQVITSCKRWFECNASVIRYPESLGFGEEAVLFNINIFYLFFSAKLHSHRIEDLMFFYTFFTFYYNTAAFKE